MKQRPPPTREAQVAVLERIAQLEADRARLHAQALAARAELAQLWADERSGFAQMELAGTALVGQYRAARELDDATRAGTLFPKLTELLAAGAVLVPAAELLLAATRLCAPEVQAAVDARVSDQLVGRNVTDARRLVTSTVLAVEAEIDPELTQQRLDAAKKGARVWVSPGTDGMTAIGAALDAVVGRRWALDFESLVKAQRLLDKRSGNDRGIDEVRVEVFGNLPTLVLELVKAARSGRLAELAELDEEAAAELAQLAEDTRDLPLPEEDEPDAAADPATGEVRVESDPCTEERLAELVALDPWSDLPPAVGDEPPPDPPEPAPPPNAVAAQDAAFWGSASRIVQTGPPDPMVEVLLLRCLRLPLPDPVVVNLHLPMATALQLSDDPGVLEGHGPLDAFRIRLLLPNAALREVFVDETTGVPLGARRRAERARPGQADVLDLARRLRPVVLRHDAEPQHDPSAALSEFVKLRDQRCSGPGCTMPASRCDLDHGNEFPRGPTAEWNLDDKSRRCHGAKHHGWTAIRQEDGSSDWTSPTGRTYRSHSPWLRPPRINPKYAGMQIHLPPSRYLIEIETELG
jgi:hypothetical protein